MYISVADPDALLHSLARAKECKMRGGKIRMKLKSDRQKGLSYKELCRKYNVDRRTAKKYAQSDSRPEYVLTEAKPSKLDPYKAKINIWLVKHQN